MIITYRSDIVPPIDDIIDLCSNAGLDKPLPDRDHVAKMYANSSW
jgi:hypothetical protein